MMRGGFGEVHSFVAWLVGGIESGAVPPERINDEIEAFTRRREQYHAWEAYRRTGIRIHLGGDLDLDRHMENVRKRQQIRALDGLNPPVNLRRISWWERAADWLCRLLFGAEEA